MQLIKTDPLLPAGRREETRSLSWRAKVRDREARRTITSCRAADTRAVSSRTCRRASCSSGYLVATPNNLFDLSASVWLILLRSPRSLFAHALGHLQTLHHKAQVADTSGNAGFGPLLTAPLHCGAESHRVSSLLPFPRRSEAT